MFIIASLLAFANSGSTFLSVFREDRVYKTYQLQTRMEPIVLSSTSVNDSVQERSVS